MCGSIKVKPNYLLAIAANIRSQIEESQCTIATTKLVMTWSALMTVYILAKLNDHLVKQGPVSNSLPPPPPLSASILARPVMALETVVTETLFRTASFARDGCMPPFPLPLLSSSVP